MYRGLNVISYYCPQGGENGQVAIVLLMKNEREIMIADAPTMKQAWKECTSAYRKAIRHGYSQMAAL